MKKAILLVDGENFKNFLKRVLVAENLDKNTPGIENYNYEKLFQQVLLGYKLTEKRFFVARLREHSASLKKSQSLIAKQRVLKTTLEKQGFEFVVSGNVRAQSVIVHGKSKTVFKEKGVDVKIAVDLVALACDQAAETVILCSSDSDLQPAVEEVKKRGVNIIYLGFQISPNKGLMYTCNQAILIRNSEVSSIYK